MTLTLPEEPTRAALDAIRDALYVPLTATPSTIDRLRERAIYRAVVRAVTPEKPRVIWAVEGSGREGEPATFTLTADSEAEIGKATLALLKDGFSTITVRAEQVRP